MKINSAKLLVFLSFLLVLSSGTSKLSALEGENEGEGLGLDQQGLIPLPTTEDQEVLPDLLPTTYYLAFEEKVSCVGRYRQVEYNGTELSDVKTPEGKVLATVCTRFYQVLKMEGSGVLKDRGQGPLTINWAGPDRFKIMERCIFGEGVEGLCLLPFHTLAADLSFYRPGDVLFIQAARGILLPDGTIHSGYFLVRDTGGAFRGIGSKRIDMFVADQIDGENVFANAGFHHRKPMAGQRISGASKQMFIKFLKNKYPQLF